MGFMDALSKEKYKSGQGIKLGAHSSLILEFTEGTSESSLKMRMNRLAGYTSFDQEKPQPNRVPLIRTLEYCIRVGHNWRCNCSYCLIKT